MKTGISRTTRTLAAIILIAATARGQNVLQGSNTKLAGYYPPPRQAQMRWLLEGAKTQPQSDGRLLITEAKLQTFTPDGGREMTARAPQCWYSRQAGALSSAGPLQATFADGEFTLEGEGFLLQQTNFSLALSNRVHTRIRGGLLGNVLPAATASSLPSAEATPGAAQREVEVFSDQFSYATNTGHGIYRENVRVMGTNLAMTSRVLDVVVPVKERRVETISAEGDVQVDSSGLRVSGQQALYTVRTDQFHLSGNPAWRALDKEGAADDLVLDRTNGALRATGNARLTALAGRAGGYGFLNRPGQVSAPTSNAVAQVVEIHSGDYLLRTNFAVFHDQVRAEERAGEKVQGTMTCGELTLVTIGANTTATAERDVDLRQTDADTAEQRRFTCGQAVYQGTNGAITLTQDPKWEAGEREGRGDTMTVWGEPEAMDVDGNAFMRLPAEEIAKARAAESGARPPAQTASPKKAFAEIHSRSYRLTPRGATFAGPVRIQHPEMTLSSGKLSVDALKDKRSRRILAEDGVVFDLVDDKGQTLHGTGEKADMISGIQIDPGWATSLARPYLTAGRTNEILVLTGGPALLTTEMKRGAKTESGNVENKLIIVDGIRHRVTTPGRYVMRGQGPPINTDRFELLQGKSVK